MKSRTRSKAEPVPEEPDIFKQATLYARRWAFRQAGRAVVASLLKERFHRVSPEPQTPRDEVLKGLSVPTSALILEAVDTTLPKLQNALIIFSSGEYVEKLFTGHQPAQTAGLICVMGRYRKYPVARAHYEQAVQQTSSILRYRSVRVAIYLVAYTLLLGGRLSRSEVNEIVRWSTRAFGSCRRALGYRRFAPARQLLLDRAARRIQRSKKAGRRPRR